MPGENKNSDMHIITIIRYLLETATSGSLDKIEKHGLNDEYVKMMGSAKKGLITDEQMEYAVMFYSLKPSEIITDLEDFFGVMKKMVTAATKGGLNV